MIIVGSCTLYPLFLERVRSTFGEQHAGSDMEGSLAERNISTLEYPTRIS